MFQHPFSTIKKMADFINVSQTDDFIREIIEKCSFDNIKKHKYDSTRIIDPKQQSTLFRKGNFIAIDKLTSYMSIGHLYLVTVILTFIKNCIFKIYEMKIWLKMILLRFLKNT